MLYEVITPGRVETNFGSIRIKNLVDLRFISTGVFENLLRRQGWPSSILARRITDHAGEIAYQEHDMVAKILKMTQLVQQDRMA